VSPSHLAARRATPVTGAIIIPAHNEGDVIEGTLRRLQPLLAPSGGGEPAIDVIVVVNGSTDRTADAARRVPGVIVIESSVGSKPLAMNTGDAATDRWPRLYLDADIDVEPAAVEAVFRELSRSEGPLAARPTSLVETSGCSLPVRAYYRARARIPERGTRLWGAGMYALSEAGHARFAAFPEVTADDSWVDGLFADDEKAVVETPPALVHAPATARALIAILSRHRRGHIELDSAAARSMDQARALLRTVRGPVSALDAGCYAVLATLARLRARRGVGAGTGRWETDATSRARRWSQPSAVGAGSMQGEGE
jgi:glycosyltransferase involved in cell wall biosynthesis